MLHIQAVVDLLAGAHLEVGQDQGPVTARQDLIGTELPAAVAEWYSLIGAQELITTHSCDELVPLSTLGEPIPFWPDGSGPNFTDRDFLREDLVFLGSENQGVVFWAVPFDEGPNPRVLVNLSPPDGAWTSYAASFSDYTETLVWDLLLFGPHSEIDPKENARPAWYGVTAQDTPLVQTDLAMLAARFEERPRTYGWPAPTTHRFERPGQRVLLWASEDQTGWWIFADSPRHLNDLVSELWEFGNLANSLRGLTGIGKALLRGHREAENSP